MKLQGKKTGAFADFIGYVTQASPTIDLSTGEIMLTVRYMDAGVNCYKDYKTIAEFNKDWEDYEPAEPLIKDEKIRKAVKVWAEANELEPDFEVRYSESSFTLISWQASIEFNSKIDGLEHDKKYTITELCGEEEK